MSKFKIHIRKNCSIESKDPETGRTISKLFGIGESYEGEVSRYGIAKIKLNGAFYFLPESTYSYTLIIEEKQK